MAEPILRVEQLQKVFALDGGATLEAVRQISFEVERGEIFAFLGPNGAGKTTTISMITTQMRPTGGRVFLAGEPIWENLSRTRRKFSVVAQHNNLDRGLTARENLLFHARYFGVPNDEAQKRAERLLETMGLIERADHPVTQFSGGMAQRVKIARALMHDPELLFLDEPTTGLDPTARARLWEEFERLNREGMTIFLTTHYMEEPERLADRVALLDQGELQALDTPGRLKQMVPGQNVIHLRLEGDLNSLEAKAKALPEVEDATADMDVLHLYMSTSTPDLAAVVAWVRQQGLSLRGLELRTSTLDDVFVHLTGKELQQ